MAEPQKTAAITTICDDNVQQQQRGVLKSTSSNQRLLQSDSSPLSTHSRSELETPDSISPVMKTRKSASHKSLPPEKDLGSPKSKNWKDLLFRRGGGSSSSSSHSTDLNSPSNFAAKLSGSIGVSLKNCPMVYLKYSSNNFL